MKVYKLIHLNKKMKLTFNQDLEQAQDIINKYVKEGWILQQIVSSNIFVNQLVGVFYKEE